MVGKGHVQRQQLKVSWAESRGAQRDNRANIVDLRSWHEHREIRGRMTEESASRFVIGFVTPDGCPIMVSEREIFSVVARVAWDVQTPLDGIGSSKHSTIPMGGKSAGDVDRGAGGGGTGDSHGC